MSTYDLDFADIGNADPYSNADLLFYGNPMVVENSIAVPKDFVGKASAAHAAPIASTGNVDVSATVSFSSGNFEAASAGIGFFHKDTFNAYAIRFRFNEAVIRGIAASGTLTSLGDNTTTSYAAGDTFRMQLDRSTTPPKFKSYLNGVLLGSVDSPITDFTNYRAGMYIQHSQASNVAGFRTFGVVGLVIAEPERIVSVGNSGSMNQYQKAVPVVVEGVDTANITEVAFAGSVVTPTITSSTAFTFDAPGNLSSGTYAVTVTAGAVVATKSATYVQTHPIDVPDAGTVVHVDSILAQLGNPNNNRWLLLNKPAGLDWKSPHTGFTAENIALAISELFTAKPDATVGTNYQATGSVLDDTGTATDFIMTFTVDPAVNPSAFRLFIVPDYQSIYAKVAI